MRFAEVFLRLGCSLVAWMMVYTYCVWLAALHVMGCGPDGAEMHQLLLGLAPVTCGVALLLRMTRPFPDIHRMLSWLGVPVALLMPFALLNVWRVFERTHLDAMSVCAQEAPNSWQPAWAPVQLAALLVIAFLILSVWRSTRHAGPKIEQSD